MQGNKGAGNDNAPDENGIIDEYELSIAPGFDQAHQGMSLVAGANQGNSLNR